MRKLLPVFLILLGLAAGAGAGVLLQPKATGHESAADKTDAGHAAPTDKGETADKGDPHAADTGHADTGHADTGHADTGHADTGHAQASSRPDDGSIEVVGGGQDSHGGVGAVEYVKLSNQFVVPLVDNGQVTSMMVLTLSLEVGAGGGDAVFAREPKLRDALLQVLFDHANADGFRGRFTDADAMAPLRRALREAAMKVLPGTVQDVLIADIVRHDG